MTHLKIVDAGARSHLPFSPGIVAGDFMYVSGQASVDGATGAIVVDSFEGEMRRSIANLRAILEETLVGLGVRRDRIDHVRGCTVCDEERFFSYRREGQVSGRMLSAIAVRQSGA